MKCLSCHTFVSKVPVNWKCPRCGEKLPEPTRWYYFSEYMTDYLNEKGIIFWTIWYAIFILIVGALEMLFTRDSYLLPFIGNGLLLAIIGFFHGGMLLDMVMKINLPLRTPGGQDFIIKERVVIRNIRKATNAALLAGLIFCFFWLRPQTFMQYFPTYSLLISWFLGLAWSITALFLDPRMSEDIRFRLYMERLGILGLKRFRRIGTTCIGLLIIVAITYNVLVNIPRLWINFYNTGFVAFFIQFVQGYLGWLF